MIHKFLIVGVLFFILFLALYFAMPKISKVKKDAYVNDFEEFVGNLKDNHKDYSKAEWEIVEEEYKELSIKEKKSHEEFFTKEDSRRISSLEGEYSSYRASGLIDNFIETTKDAINNAAEYVDGFIKGLNDELINDTTDE